MSTVGSNEGLKRVIGIPALVIAIISGVIGAGIFALPGVVGDMLGPYGIFAYIVCGILFASVMLCYAEIGSRVTTSGGSYAYVEAAFGNMAGYLINWMYFFGWGILGGSALINILVDSLAGIFPSLHQPMIRILLIFCVVVFIIGINVFGAKQSLFFVNTVTVIKLLPLLGIIILGLSQVHSANLHFGKVPSVKTFADATLLLFFAFAGFETVLGASGEIKNPRRSVPVGIIIAGVTVLIFYILIQTIAQGVLGAQIIEFKETPLAAVANNIIGPVGATILLISAALSCFGNVTLDIMCTPRSLFAGANDGLFPKFLGKVHSKYHTPYLAVISYGLLMFIVAVSGGFKELAIMANAVVLLIYLSVILATLKLRKKEKGKDAQIFRVPGGLIIPVIGITTILWLLSSLDYKEIISAFLFMAAVCLLYLIKRWTKRKSILQSTTNE